MSKLALVTGGAGFIGSHLAEGLLHAGYAVRILDDLSSGRRENLASIANEVDLRIGSVTDPDAVSAAMAGVDIVYHEAAIPSVQRSVEDPIASHRVNLDGTLNVLVAARDAGVGRFVFAGSSSAYGNSETLPKHEDMMPAPLSPYAAQKLASEAYAKAFACCHDIQTVVLRYFNVYGPRQDPSSPYSGVISLFITALLEGRAPRIYGDGEQSRDFVYVADVVQANVAAATADGRGGALVNIAGGRQITVNELFRQIRTAVGAAAAEIEPEYAPGRTGDVRDSLAELGRAGRLLDYAPSVPLHEGIQRTVDYYHGLIHKEHKS